MAVWVTPTEPVRARNLRRSRILAGTLLAAFLGWFGGPTASSTIPPLGLGRHPAHFQTGPSSTRANHGYATGDRIASIPVESYVLSAEPKAIGLQFLGASQSYLAKQGLSLTAITPNGRHLSLPLTITPTGFVGYQVHHPLQPGPWTFQLHSLQYGRTPRWTVHVQPVLKLPRPTSAGRAALETLNALRLTLHLHSVVWSRRLALAAIYHARYVATYGYQDPSFHVERPGPLYFGTKPWDRDLRAGWPDASTGEVGVAGPRPVSGPLFIAALTNTVYHRLGLLSPNALAAGSAADLGSKDSATIMDIGYGYRSDLPLAVAFPPPGAQGVATAWTDNESPDPVPGGQGRRYGYPVTLDCPTIHSLGEATIQLTRGKKVVSAYVDAPGVGDMGPNQIGLVPKSPLEPFSTYRVSVVSDNVTYNNGLLGSLDEWWQFRTGGAAESVYLVPQGTRLMAVLAVPGQLNSLPGTRVAITIRHHSQAFHRTAIIGPTGAARVTLPHITPGLWIATAVTDTGNQGRVTWTVAR